MDLKSRLSSDFLKHVVTLVLGTGLAQVINFCGIMALARIYDPEEYMLFTLFSSVAMIITSIACLRYEFAIPLPAQDKDARRIVVLATYILVAICVLSLLTIIGWHLVRSINGKSFHIVLYLVPLYVVFAGGTQIFNYWSTRMGTFRRNFISRVLAAAATVGFSIVFGLVTGNSLGLVLGAILGQFVSWVVLGWNSFPVLRSAYAEETRAGLFELAKSYKKFPLYNAPNAVFDAFQDYGVVFVMNYYFAPEVSSLYFQSYRLLGAPLGLIGAAIYQVFYPKMARNFADSRNVRKELLRIYGVLLVLAAPVFLTLFLFTDEIIYTLLGEKWMAAAAIMKVLIPWMFLNFLISPISGITLVTGKQKQSFFFSITGFIMKFVSLIIGGLYGSYYLGFVCLSASSSCLMIAGIVWYWYIAKSSE